jgi:predicted DNA-binding protein
MKAMTIRGIDKEISQRLKTLSAKQGKSVNQLTVEIIKQSLGLVKERKFTREYDDLDDLFGRWKDAEFKEISAKLAKERQIDQELWQ